MRYECSRTGGARTTEVSIGDKGYNDELHRWLCERGFWLVVLDDGEATALANAVDTDNLMRWHRHNVKVS